MEPKTVTFTVARLCLYATMASRYIDISYYLVIPQYSTNKCKFYVTYEHSKPIINLQRNCIHLGRFSQCKRIQCKVM